MDLYTHVSGEADPAAQPKTSTVSPPPSSSPGGPHGVYVVLWRDAAAGDFLVLGVFDTLRDANADVRQQGRQQLSDGLADTNCEADAGGIDAEPLRWDTADGIACWVEHHSVVPGKASGA